MRRVEHHFRFFFSWIDANKRVVHVTCAEIKFVLVILHQSLTCAHADNGMQPKETNKNSRSWYPITLVQSTRGLGKLAQEKITDSHFGYFRVFKEYPQKSQIWKSETSPNQGIWLGIP